MLSVSKLDAAGLPIAIACLMLINVNFVLGLGKFTNLQCRSEAKQSLIFQECRLQTIQRGVDVLHIIVNMSEPIEHTNMTVRLQLLKRTSGYKPFLYDVTVDVCDYLARRNNAFINIFAIALERHMGAGCSLNSCPLVSVAVLKNFRFPDQTLAQMLPLPAGEYALYGTLVIGVKPLATVKIYFSLK